MDVCIHSRAANFSTLLLWNACILNKQLLYYHYNHFTAHWTVSGTTRVSQYQKGKTNLDLLQQLCHLKAKKSQPLLRTHFAPAISCPCLSAFGVTSPRPWWHKIQLISLRFCRLWTMKQKSGIASLRSKLQGYLSLLSPLLSSPL